MSKSVKKMPKNVALAFWQDTIDFMRSYLC